MMPSAKFARFVPAERGILCGKRFAAAAFFRGFFYFIR
ncbi:hypothetical protein HMPREF1141_0025 [Clostridium sp. MSTE9]|nr:hypothetical protein HMPREF1141_0025 [Clostridium sp. MSTE9]